jgi:hypothetical protein
VFDTRTMDVRVRHLQVNEIITRDANNAQVREFRYHWVRVAPDERPFRP